MENDNVETEPEVEPTKEEAEPEPTKEELEEVKAE